MMAKSQIELEYQELTSNVLSCFHATCGEGTKERFENDEDFAESLRNAALASMAVIAMACIEDDYRFQEKAPSLVGDPKDDTDEVAMLRVFALDNFATEVVREVKGVTSRLQWFRQAYLGARGGALRHVSLMQ
jgi:hypothetical protein